MQNNSFCIFLIFFCFFVSCKEKQSKKNIVVVKKAPDSFNMYKTSEMASLMRTMLEKNKDIKGKIIQGNTLGSFSSEYLKIHTAQLTDSTDLDETYPVFASHFVSMQKAIFTVDKSEQKQQFNKAINACIACHQDRCAGPIPRIKKLLIE